MAGLVVENRTKATMRSSARLTPGKATGTKVTEDPSPELACTSTAPPPASVVASPDTSAAPPSERATVKGLPLHARTAPHAGAAHRTRSPRRTNPTRTSTHLHYRPVSSAL